MRLRPPLIHGLIAVTVACWSGTASAQFADAMFEPSARTAGMGGAGAAVVWSGDRNAWANPALLGYAAGLSLRWGRAYVWPDYERTTAGGIGYGWGGMGASYDRDELLLGDARSALGIPFPYAFTWRLRRLGAGVSVARVIETVRGGDAPGFARYADLGVGFTHKHLDIRPLPTEEPPNAVDFGLLARTTPSPGRTTGLRSVQIAYGFAMLKEPLEWWTSSLGHAIVPWHQRHGLGIHLGLPFAAHDSAGLGRFAHRLARGAEPMLVLTLAADFDQMEDEIRLFGSGRNPASWGHRIGGELELANAVALRVGHVKQKAQLLDDFTFGFGIAPPIYDFARIRYDYARYPRFFESGKGNRHSVSLWLDPTAMMRR